MGTYNRLIKENCAPQGATGVGVYNGSTLVGTIPLSGLARPNFGNKLYSFGALSDVHTDPRDDSSYASDDDFKNALTYLKNKNVDFVTICGDLTDVGSQSQLEAMKSIAASKGWTFGTNIFTCMGNHEVYSKAWDNYKVYNRDTKAFDSTEYALFTIWKDITGMNKHQVVMKGGDVFVFFSLNSAEMDSNSKYRSVYLPSDIAWLYQILKIYRNKRVFLITHMFFRSMAGNYGEGYGYPMDSQSENLLLQLLSKYQNVVWLSGHSHWRWNAQGQTEASSAAKGNNYDANVAPANATTRNTGWTVHISSCGKPREPWASNPNPNYNYKDEPNDGVGKIWSEFAIIDVYENGIFINGISHEGSTLSVNNYISLPIAQYALNTTLRNIDDSGLSDLEDLFVKTVVGKTTHYMPKCNYTDLDIAGYVDQSITLPSVASITRFDGKAHSGSYSYANRVTLSGSTLTFKDYALNENMTDATYEAHAKLMVTDSSGKTRVLRINPTGKMFLTTDGTNPVTNPVVGTTYNVMFQRKNATSGSFSNMTKDITTWGETLGTATVTGSIGTVKFNTSGTYTIIANYYSSSTGYNLTQVLKISI